MGPRHEWRGNIAIFVCRVSIRAELQWGRATNGAEIKFIKDKSLLIFHCFNGAAPRMARKSRIFLVFFIVATSLQWGRATNGAVMWTTVDTGTSSSSSFNGAAPRMARKCEGWSPHIPNFSTASMGPRHEWRGNAPRSICLDTNHVASMGPRHEWRGNANRPAPVRGFFRRFNGAAPRMARKSFICAAKMSRSCGFNGAAPRMARKSLMI